MTLSITAGPEIQVNTDTSGNQFESNITQLDNGNFIVVWLDSDASSGGCGIMGQLLDPAGNKIAGEFLINSTAGVAEDTIEVTALTTGGFAVSWTDVNGDGNGLGIISRIYDDSGVAVTPELHVNNLTAGDEWGSSLTALNNGQFLVVWQDNVADGSGYAAEGQLFDSAGNKIGGEFQINQTTPGYENAAQAAPLAGGGFVIVWNEESWTGADPSFYGVKARIYDASGNPTTDEFLVNTTISNSQGAPYVAALTNGNFVVCWMDDSGATDHSGQGVIAQILDASGNKIGGEFLVNTNTAGDQYPMSIVALPSGGFVIGFNDATGDADGWATKAQMFDASGNKVGGEILLNETTAGVQVNPDLVATETGFAAVWNGGTGFWDPNFYHDIYFRAFTQDAPDTTPPDAPAGLAYDTDTGVLSGTAEAGSTVSVYDGGTLIGTVAAAGDGSWSYGADSSFEHDFTATATDPAGNTGTLSGHVIAGAGADDFFNGTSGDETMYGAAGDDFLAGRGGDDTVYGGDGSDSLRGDSPVYNGGPFGNDTLLGGAGDDLMRGGPGVDYFDGGSDSGGESIYGGIGDRVSFYEPAATAGVVADLRTGIISNDGFGNVETMVNVESLGADTAFADTFYGNDGNNTLFANRGDYLYGFGGDDNISLSSAAAVVDGGDGIDTLQVNSVGGWLMPDADADGIAETAAAATDGWTINLAAGSMVDGYGNTGTVTGIENVDGSEQSDSITGDGNANVLRGFEGSDILNGGGGDDTLAGGEGNDSLLPGTGSDFVDGGNGIDYVDYWASAGPIDLNLQAGVADEYDASGTTIVSTDTLVSIEAAIGSSFDDALVGSSADNYFDGVQGNDTIRGAGGNDQIFGSAGNDDISGDFGIAVLTGGGNDNLDGGDGNDVVRGRDGNDIVRGGDGNDFVEGGTGDDLIDGGSGVDRAAFYSMATIGVHVDLNLQGVAQDTNQGMDTLIGIENVSGSQFSDTLIGDDNDNWLWGNVATNPIDGSVGVNNDTLIGNGGNDLLMVGIGDHSLTGGTGIDTVAFTENGNPEPGVTISLELQGVAQATGGGSWTLNGIENLSGGIADDTLTGDSNNNLLAGDSGNDHLIGGDGDDTLYGDGRIGPDYAGGPGTSGPIATFADVGPVDPTAVDGNDTLEGGVGDDTLIGGGGDDTLSGGAGDDYLEGNSGNDSLDGTEGNDTLAGGVGDDTLYGNGTSTVASYSGPRSQYLFTENADGSVTVTDTSGADGTDTLWNVTQLQFADGDVFFGTPGDDGLVGTPGDDIMYGRNGNDLMIGLSGNDKMYGEAGDDQIVGRVGNDALYGGDGNDFFRGDSINDGAGTAGDDYIDGGAGFDRVAYYNYENGVTVSLLLQGAPQNTGQGWDTLVNVEALSGTPFNDSLIGDDADNWLRGSSAGLDGRTFTSDTILANGGNDLIEVTMGNHSVDGGSGTDTLAFNAQSSNLSGGLTVLLTSQGATQNTGQGSMTISGIENLSGSAFNDTFAGDAGNNTLAGAGGGDFLFGGAGNDVLLGDGEIGILYSAANSGSGPIHTFLSQDYAGVDFYDASGSIVYLFQGQDLYDSAGNRLNRVDLIDEDGAAYSHFTLNGVGYDFYANSSDSGDTGSDGLPGNDFLIGGDGNDTLIGGAGADTLIGGAGSDTFTLLALSDSKVGVADLINDFDEKTDKLDFTAIDANANAAGHQDFIYVKAFTGAGGEIVANYDSKAKLTHLLFDVNGDGIADMQLDLSGNHSNLSQLSAATVHSPAPFAGALAGPESADLQLGYVPDHASLI